MRKTIFFAHSHAPHFSPSHFLSSPRAAWERILDAPRPVLSLKGASKNSIN